ncbi:hypothetical protein OIO90_006471 [Microbotryomycetes sp. JL221]|nr:hypothetical protein OIO90_006471 [Microbotryomycetes sp. JL221]
MGGPPHQRVSHARSWWKEACVYQIYPASYADSNGDGVGDLPGIIERVPYIKSLGVDVIWISPFFKSPQYDLGYDISDYKDVHRPYGTVADAERLIETVHEHGMKIIFDLVINHTSHEHEWFKESRSSKTNPKRDWYIWRPARYIDGERHPPCNWRGAFGGSVWEWDEHTEEYYLHLFTPEQPDVNWENPTLRQALYDDAVKFWLDKGCDGFRIDTVNMYSKFLDFPDVPVVDPNTPWQPAPQYFSNGPRLHEFLQELNRETFSKYDCMTIGECPHTPDLDKVLEFVAAARKELNMVIQFDLADLDHGRGRFPLFAQEWTLAQWKAISKRAQALAEPRYGAWATTYLENHDQARSVTRYASDSEEHRVIASKMLATYLMTVSGTPIIYQGEEIGMKNCPRDWSIEEEYKDIGTINVWNEVKEAAARQNEPELLELGRKGIQLTARDHARTPMQWDSSPQAGFSTSKDTWMRVMDSYVDINVASQQTDKNSTLAFYRRMTHFRRQYKDLFIYGLFEILDEANPHTMVYTKRSTEDENKVALVALNFTAQEQAFEIPAELAALNMQLALETVRNKGPLAAFEARVYISQAAF